MTNINRESHDELIMLVEDVVEYWCSEQFKEGTPVSGEAAYKIIQAYATAKELEFEGVFN